MQYILTEKEYQEIIDAANTKSITDRNMLLDLCRRVANYEPVVGNYEDNTRTDRPWGCLIDARNFGCCDKCPVKNVCPYDRKEFSK